MALNSFRKRCSVYPLLCASFCDKNGNVAHQLLLQTMRKAADKTFERHFQKEFKDTCKNSSESDLKQQRAIRNAT